MICKSDCIRKLNGCLNTQGFGELLSLQPHQVLPLASYKVVPKPAESCHVLPSHIKVCTASLRLRRRSVFAALASATVPKQTGSQLKRPVPICKTSGKYWPNQLRALKSWSPELWILPACLKIHICKLCWHLAPCQLLWVSTEKINLADKSSLKCIVGSGRFMSVLARRKHRRDDEKNWWKDLWDHERRVPNTCVDGPSTFGVSLPGQSLSDTLQFVGPK